MFGFAYDSDCVSLTCKTGTLPSGNASWPKTEDSGLYHSSSASESAPYSQLCDASDRPCVITLLMSSDVILVTQIAASVKMVKSKCMHRNTRYAYFTVAESSAWDYVETAPATGALLHRCLLQLDCMLNDAINTHDHIPLANFELSYNLANFARLPLYYVALHQLPAQGRSPAYSIPWVLLLVLQMRDPLLSALPAQESCPAHSAHPQAFRRPPM